mgnify:CR=1 FL=1
MATHADSNATTREGAAKARATSLDVFCAERGLSKRFVAELVAQGKLKVGRVGRRVLVYLEDALDFDRRAREQGV